MKIKVRGKNKKGARSTPVERLRIRATRFADRKKVANRYEARGRTARDVS